jgi:hypothetical protein
MLVFVFVYVFMLGLCRTHTVSHPFFDGNVSNFPHRSTHMSFKMARLFSAPLAINTFWYLVGVPNSRGVESRGGGFVAEKICLLVSKHNNGNTQRPSVLVNSMPSRSPAI